MSIYHLHVKIIGRGAGRSAVAAAAYRAGEKLYNTAIAAASYRSGEQLRDEYMGIKHDYTRKTGVVYTEIILPENAPKEFENREMLWNAVELSEKRKDARTTREVELALPAPLERREQIELLREYIGENFVSRGMCADFAVHDKGDGNPHAHIMLTTRNLSEAGFGGKNRDWDKVECLESWRERWADVCNEKFQQKGLTERIDHRTLEAQGIDREPTVHVGRNPERARQNEEIKRRNESRTPAAVAERMNELRDKFDVADRRVMELCEKRREADTLKYRADDMAERLADIRGRSAESLHVARERFKRHYGIDIYDAPAVIQRMRAQSDVIMREGGEIEKWRDTREKIAAEYQKQRLLAEIRPDGREILRRIKRPPPQLERVTDERFRQILREVKPEHARLLIERRQRERERERERVFTREFERSR